jgi:hypothetical protein
VIVSAAAVANTMTRTKKVVGIACLRGQKTRIRILMFLSLVLEVVIGLIVLRIRLTITHRFRFRRYCHGRLRLSRDAQGDCRRDNKGV